MGRTRYRVSELAAEADIDLDEALVTLWDSGIDVAEPGDFIPREDVAKARAALGVTDPKKLMQVDYWLQIAELDRTEFCSRLSAVGVHVSEGARRLPRNSLRRVRQLFEPANRVILGASDQGEQQGQPPLAPLEWLVIGHTPIRSYLSVGDLAAIHESLTTDFLTSGDPISPPGIKDENLLDSAANRPLTGLGDQLKYQTAEMAGAALFHSIVLNHAFHNGNKRTGLVSLLAFLDRNGLVMTCTEEELFRMTLRVAQHSLLPVSADSLADREVVAIAHWVRRNSRPVQHGERPMKWSDLQRALGRYGCECEMASGKGNRMNIKRVVISRGFLRQRKRVLATQVACSGLNTEAEKNTIHKVRRELELDDEHDVDSASFYEGAEVDAFIIEYRRILRRLGRL